MQNHWWNLVHENVFWNLLPWSSRNLSKALYCHRVWWKIILQVLNQLSNSLHLQINIFPFQDCTINTCGLQPIQNIQHQFHLKNNWSQSGIHHLWCHWIHWIYWWDPWIVHWILLPWCSGSSFGLFAKFCGKTKMVLDFHGNCLWFCNFKRFSKWCEWTFIKNSKI